MKRNTILATRRQLTSPQATSLLLSSTRASRQTFTSTPQTRPSLISLSSKRFLSENCKNTTCRYRDGCLAVEREALQSQRKRLMLYLVAGGLVPIAFIGATQDWRNFANTISSIHFDPFRDKTTRKRKWQDVDLSSIPDIGVLVPMAQLRLCGCGCGKDATVGGYEVEGGTLWLKEHFRCADCKHPLVGKMRTEPLPKDAGDETWVFCKEGKLYCVAHYMARFCNSCTHCNHQISDTDFLLDPKTGRAACVPCYNSLKDETFAPTTSLGEEEGQRLFKEVKEGLSELLGLDFGKSLNSPIRNIPLNVVTAQEMAQVKNSATYGSSSSASLGLTVKKRNQDDFFRPQKVLVLHGMNKLKTGSVLAHELMHCWLAENVLNGKERDYLLPLDVEEGLCELVAYLWLLNEKQSSHDNKKTVLSGMEDVHVELIRMENNDDRQQGLSFHQAFHALKGRTFKQLLSYVVQEGCFPPTITTEQK